MPDTPPEVPVPDAAVAAYEGHKEVKLTTEKTLGRWVLAILLLTLAISVGSQIYSTVEIHNFRTTQVQNAKVNKANAVVERCSADSNHVIALDVHLLIAKDENPADYKVPKKC